MGKTVDRMKEQCGSPWAYARGYEIYHRGKIESFKQRVIDHGLVQISALVEGSKPGKEYDVELMLDEDTKDLVDYSCACPAYSSYDGPCKHCIAVALRYEEETKDGQEEKEEKISIEEKAGKKSRRKASERIDDEVYREYERETEILEKKAKMKSWTRAKEPVKIKHYQTSDVARKLITEYTYKKNMEKGKEDVGGGILLEPILNFQYYGMEVSFRVGDKRLYSIKDLLEFSEAIKYHKNIAYGKQLEFIHMPAMFAEESRGLLAFIIDSVQEMVYENPVEYTYTALRRKIPSIRLTPQRFERLMSIMMGRKICLRGMYRGELTMFLERQDLILDMEVKKLEEGAFEFIIPETNYIMGVNHMYIMQGAYLYEASEEYTRHMADFWQLLEKNGREYRFTVTKDYLPAFLSNVVPLIRDYIGVGQIEEVCKEYIPPKGQIKYYIDSTRHNIYVRSCAKYGNKEYNIFEAVATSSS